MYNNIPLNFYQVPYAGQNTSHGKLTQVQSTSSKFRSVWCHLCKLTFSGYDNFRMHIMQKHRSYDENTDTDISDEEHEYSKNDQISKSLEDNDEFDINSDENEDISESNFDEETTENILEDDYLDDSLTQIKAHLKDKEKDRKPSDSKPKQLKVKNLLEQISEANQSAAPLNSTMNTYGNPQFLVNNNQLSMMSPIVNQPMMNNYLMGNQPIIQYTSMLNPVNAIPTKPTNQGFDFNSRNIIKWFMKFKKLGRSLKYPLSPRVLKKTKIVYKAIFDNSNFVSAFKNAEKKAVYEIYEELDIMISRHIESIGEQL